VPRSSKGIGGVGIEQEAINSNGIDNHDGGQQGNDNTDEGIKTFQISPMVNAVLEEDLVADTDVDGTANFSFDAGTMHAETVADVQYIINSSALVHNIAVDTIESASEGLVDSKIIDRGRSDDPENIGRPNGNDLTQEDQGQAAIPIAINALLGHDQQAGTDNQDDDQDANQVDENWDPSGQDSGSQVIPVDSDEQEAELHCMGCQEEFGPELGRIWLNCGHSRCKQCLNDNVRAGVRSR